jgi:protocatechuate 3,4-dioxygenase alpha subunit
MSAHPLTPTQTVGPFFHLGLLRDGARRTELTTTGCPGQRIRIEGHVYDGDRAAVPDALIEIWQADSEGHYHGPDRPAGFLGYGRTATDVDGAYWFDTIKPGAVPYDRERLQAPHIGVAIFGRGLLNHLYTRLYFADDPATADDPVLRCVPAERRATLLAQRSAATGGVAVYRFDIILQGPGETVFFHY